MNGHNVTYFDSSGAEYIPQEIKKSIGNKNITTNIYRIQANDLIMCEYFCIGFINFMSRGKKDFTSSFSPNEYQKSDKYNIQILLIT